MFTKINLFEWLEWNLLGLGIALLVLVEIHQPNLALILGLLAAAFALRAARTRRLLPRTGVELPLGIFLASAALSAWVAYDRSLSFLQLANILAAAVAFYAVVGSSPDIRRLVALAVIIFGIALGTFFILRHDFTADLNKFAPIANLGLILNAILPAVPGPAVHPNLVGAVLSMSIPLMLVLLVEAWNAERGELAGLAALLALLATLELILTSSRGAWLGLIGALGLGGLVLIQRRWLPDPSAQRAFWLG